MLQLMKTWADLRLSGENNYPSFLLLSFHVGLSKVLILRRLFFQHLINWLAADVIRREMSDVEEEEEEEEGGWVPVRFWLGEYYKTYKTPSSLLY